MKKQKPFNLDEGSFTAQAKAKKMSIAKFSNFVIKSYKNPKSTGYRPVLKTYRRAIFYKNFVK